MLSIISAKIAGLGQNADIVGCFDPTLVRLRLIDAFPEATVCLEDHLRSRINAARERYFREGMTASQERVLGVMENDDRRRGPIWSFRLRTGTTQVVWGNCDRHGVGVMSKEPIPEPLKSRLVAFLEGLRLSSVEVSSVCLDGNRSTEV